MMNKLKTPARLIYGLLWVIFGLNFFFHFLPMPQQQMSEAAGTYMTGLAAASYFFPLLKVTEVVVGLLLLANIAVPLALVVISPIVLQILLYHTILVPDGAPIAIAMTVLNLFLGIAYWNNFKPLFKKG
ncbi:MAG: acyltransferase [Bdellovibrio sp.]|jgi:hypothetical protein|nr:acyltransferase [Bdellovibrio sp.]